MKNKGNSKKNTKKSEPTVQKQTKKSLNTKDSTTKTPKRRTTDKKTSKLSNQTIITIASTLFITIGTIIAISYIRGYNINIDGKLEKTGVISLNSSPSFSNTYLDQESIGKTPQTKSLISAGTHNVRIEKDGYFTWDKDIEIKEGKATPITVPLYYSSPEKEEILKGEKTIVEIFNDNEKENIFFMTTKDVSNPEDSKETQLVQIQKYATQTRFWQNSNNPTLVFEQVLLTGNLPTLSPSQDGKYLLLEFSYGEIILQDEELPVEPMEGAYILATNNTTDELISLPSSLEDIAEDFIWSTTDSLLVYTENILLSVEVPDFSQTVLLTGEISDIVYTLDEKGNLYYLSLTEEQEADGITEKSYYSINQTTPSGKDSEVIGKIYFKDTDTYLNSDSPEELQTPFTNSASNYRFAGEIKSFTVDSKTDSIIIQTEFALYRYNLETEKFTVISTGNSELLSFSPEHDRLLYRNPIGVGVFTFDKEEADHISHLGSEILLGESKSYEIISISWHESAGMFVYQDVYGTHTIDLDGAYNNDLLDNQGYSMISVDGEILFTLDISESGTSFSLNKYKLR
jgi:hypothetical protein